MCSKKLCIQAANRFLEGLAASGGGLRVGCFGLSDAAALLLRFARHVPQPPQSFFHKEGPPRTKRCPSIFHRFSLVSLSFRLIVELLDTFLMLFVIRKVFAGSGGEALGASAAALGRGEVDRLAHLEREGAAGGSCDGHHGRRPGGCLCAEPVP